MSADTSISAEPFERLTPQKPRRALPGLSRSVAKMHLGHVLQLKPMQFELPSSKQVQRATQSRGSRDKSAESPNLAKILQKDLYYRAQDPHWPSTMNLLRKGGAAAAKKANQKKDSNQLLITEMIRNKSQEAPLVTLKEVGQVETLPGERWKINSRKLNNKDSVDSLSSAKRHEPESFLVSPSGSSLQPQFQTLQHNASTEHVAQTYFPEYGNYKINSPNQSRVLQVRNSYFAIQSTDRPKLSTSKHTYLQLSHEIRGAAKKGSKEVKLLQEQQFFYDKMRLTEQKSFLMNRDFSQSQSLLRQASQNSDSTQINQQKLAATNLPKNHSPFFQSRYNSSRYFNSRSNKARNKKKGEQADQSSLPGAEQLSFGDGSEMARAHTIVPLDQRTTATTLRNLPFYHQFQSKVLGRVKGPAQISIKLEKTKRSIKAKSRRGLQKLERERREAIFRDKNAANFNITGERSHEQKYPIRKKPKAWQLFAEKDKSFAAFSKELDSEVNEFIERTGSSRIQPPSRRAKDVFLTHESLTRQKVATLNQILEEYTNSAVKEFEAKFPTDESDSDEFESPNLFQPKYKKKNQHSPAPPLLKAKS